MTTEKVIAILASHLDMAEADIHEDTTFEDLGVDSLDAVEVAMEMEDAFGIEVDPKEAGTSVKAFAAYIDAKLSAK